MSPTEGCGFRRRGAAHYMIGTIDAIAALHGLFVDEGLLQRVRLLGRTETFEGDDLARSDTGERRYAGARGLAVDMDGAARPHPKPAPSGPK